MSGMKTLLGDMSFEEFEEMRKTVLNDVKRVFDGGFEELYSADARRLYEYWLEVQGRELIKEKVAKYGGYILETQVEDIALFMVENFISWLEESI